MSASTEYRIDSISNHGRRQHAKTKTGCLRCKARRVKCDEGKPFCQKCTRIGVQCPGYAAPATRLFGLTKDECFKSDFDKICFQSFISKGIQDVVAFRPIAGEFWKVMVPQLGQVYTAIRHVTIAIGVLEEPFIRPEVAPTLIGPSRNVRSVAIQHFNDAIRNFVQCGSSFSMEAKLTCCILFYVLSIKLEKVPAGQTHLRAANLFMREYNDRVAAGERLLEPIISFNIDPMLQKHNLDASVFLTGFRDSHIGNPYEHNKHFLCRVPRSLTTIGEMYESLGSLLEYAIARHLQDYANEAVDDYLMRGLREFQDLIQQTGAWSLPRPGTDIAQIPFLYRQTYFKVHASAALIFAHTIRGNEWDFDAHLKEFQDIVHACELLLGDDRRDTWGITLGIISPLFLVATKCRLNFLRRRALIQLHSANRVEHAWSSCNASAVARHIILREEALNAGLATCENLRLTLHHFQLHPTNETATLQYVLLDRHGLTRKEEATIPCRSVKWPDGALSAKTIPDRVLWAAGYSGTTLFAPRIQCHCNVFPRT